MIYKYNIFTKKGWRETLFDFALKDPFFAEFLGVISDYGIDISFSCFSKVGAYSSYALSTEKLDTPEKQAAFVNGFWKRAEQGDMKAQISLPLLTSQNKRKQDFLHEIMHLYQDMHGFYFLPLQEENVFPVMLDAYSNIIAILFNEAWAQVEVIRACWAIREKGDPSGWNGAIAHQNFGHLARAYDADLQAGKDEAYAAARTFEKWYEGKYRTFYESHALDIYDLEFARFAAGVSGISKHDIGQKMRRLTWDGLMKQMPRSTRSNYFQQVNPDIVMTVRSREMEKLAQAYEEEYGAAENTAIQDIKCGAPAYLWNRLRQQEMAASTVPPPPPDVGKSANAG